MTEKTQALKFSLDRTKRRLEEFKQRNSGIPDDKIMREFAQNEGIYWEDLEQILDAANNAVLTEAPFATAGNIAGDKQAALDEFEQMLSFIALSHSYWGTCDKDFISDFAVNTIRAALSQSVPRWDPRLGLIQPEPINEELESENKNLKDDLEREVRENAKLKARQLAWESCVYTVGIPMMNTVRDTEYGDKVPPIPVVKKLTDLLDRQAELLEALKECLPRIEEIRLVDLGAVRAAEMQDYQERKILARRELAETNELINKINQAIQRAEAQKGQ